MIADIIFVGSIVFVAIMTVALCANAGKWDDVSEEYWNEYWEREGQDDESETFFTTD